MGGGGGGGPSADQSALIAEQRAEIARQRKALEASRNVFKSQRSGYGSLFSTYSPPSAFAVVEAMGAVGATNPAQRGSSSSFGSGGPSTIEQDRRSGHGSYYTPPKSHHNPYSSPPSWSDFTSFF